MLLRVIKPGCLIIAAAALLHARPSRADYPLVASTVASLQANAVDATPAVVTAMAIDPTGKLLAVAGDDQTVRILNASDFSQVAILRGHRDLIRAVTFRDDGKVLATSGNDGLMILWQASTGFAELKRFESLPAICSLDFSPDGTQLAGVGFGAEVIIFGGTKNRGEMDCDCSDLRCCAFDEKGDQVVAAGRSGCIYFFDAQSGRKLDQQELHTGRIRQCEFVRDPLRLITASEDGSAVVFDVSRREVVQRIDVLPCKLFTLAKIDDKHIAVAGSDNRIRILDLQRGVVVNHLDGHRGSISSLVYANGSLYSGGFDATVRRWSVPTDRGERLADKDVPPKTPQETVGR